MQRHDGSISALLVDVLRGNIFVNFCKVRRFDVRFTLPVLGVSALQNKCIWVDPAGDTF